MVIFYFIFTNPINFITIDVRRGVEELDKKMIDLTSNFNINTNVVITKSDKVSKSSRFQVKRNIEKTLSKQKNVKYISIFSSKSGEGIMVVDAKATDVLRKSLFFIWLKV